MGTGLKDATKRGVERKEVSPQGKGKGKFKIVSAPMREIEHKLNLLAKVHDVEVVGTSVVGNHLVVLTRIRRRTE